MGTCVTCSGSKALTLYTFHVTNKSTGAPVGGAQCAITDQLRMVKPLEGVGCITDAGGVCTVDTGTFPPRYYSVYKAGYKTVAGSVPGTTINVALVPTEVLYWVHVLAGVGGRVDPSGAFQVKAGAKLTVTAYPDKGYVLDYWTVNGVKSGSTNPISVTVDRDNFNVSAVFKQTGAPPDGAPPDGGGGVTEIKRIWDNQGLKIPWNWSCNEDKKEVKFTWDPAKTTINSVKLKVSVTVDRTPGYVEFYLNDTQVTSLAWDSLEAPGEKHVEVDVKTWLYNGANVMKATHCKGFYVPWEHTAWITGDLVIDYTGEAPVVPPPGAGLDWWWPWAIAGGAIAILTVGGVVIYQETKHREELMLLTMARR